MIIWKIIFTWRNKRYKLPCLSVYKTENEILFLPGFFFEIKELKKNANINGIDTCKIIYFVLIKIINTRKETFYSNIDFIKNIENPFSLKWIDNFEDKDFYYVIYEYYDETLEYFINQEIYLLFILMKKKVIMVLLVKEMIILKHLNLSLKEITKNVIYGV